MLENTIYSANIGDTHASFNTQHIFYIPFLGLFVQTKDWRRIRGIAANDRPFRN